MLSSKLFISLVYLFTLVQSHELIFNRHHGLKRFLKNRALPDLPVVLPSASSDSQIATSTIPQSTASDASLVTVRVFICFIRSLGFDLDAQQTSPAASTSAISTSTGAESTIATSKSTSSITSSTSSSTVTNASSSSTSAPTQTSANANVNLSPSILVPSPSVVASTITSTQSLSATASGTATPIAQSASLKTKSTTVTALIAVAASVGGIAILWTIFRKWKLSSSKEFDRRLNPITDWQPTNGEDDLIPTLRRAPSSSSSFHSGGGSGDGHIPSRSAGLTPFDHDFTPGPGNSTPIGGYADLARASSPNPPMQQALGRGPSFNHGYDVGVPLHHQTGYGAHDAYDYNGGSTRY